ncbi:MAG: glycosyltransferase [Desulfobulbaceae bacterium]|nr:glycosyltransferase [Desulfobulbaceae bacterium]
MIPAIHQYTPSITLGDGVSGSLFFIKKILASLGYKSEIYSDNIHPDLKEQVHPREAYLDHGENILFIHHAVAQPHPEWFLGLRDRLVMIYHNITPSHYFNEGTPHKNATELGRQQLEGWRDAFSAIVAISEYNREELKGFGFKNIHTIPLLADYDYKVETIADPKIQKQHEKTFNLLFVGRIAENKCQHDLIHAFYELNDNNARLFCVGGISSSDYHKYLQELIAYYQLQEKVYLTGRVSDQELWGYYRAADLFVCLSDHEGFGIPLIEASSAGLPVVAYDSSNIRHTLAGSGLLISHKNAGDVAAVWRRLIEQPEWRYRLAMSGRQNLRRFNLEVLTRQLQDFLEGLTPGSIQHRPLQGKTVHENGKHPSRVRIEGPFDSNYSLALVNRELATAFKKTGMQVELFSTEGGGDYQPDRQFLKVYPEIKEFWDVGLRLSKANVAIRNLYPPRVTGMTGERKVLGPYGWEESRFPQSWVASFNRHLHLIATMSEYVTKTLKDNGVTVPLASVGIGVDHLLDVKAEPLPFTVPQGYTLLHISSCFPRKGIGLLLRAFMSAYDDAAQVTLIIKTFPNPHNTICRQLNELGWKKSSSYTFSPQLGGGNKKIILVDEEFTPGQMVSLYQQSDLLVAPSRGEGFGLPMAEAMLFHLPVVTTGYGGQIDFCTSETAWLLDYKFKRAQTHMQLSDSVWAEPDLDDLVMKMELLPTLTPLEIKKKTDRAAENISRHFTWLQVAKRLRRAVSKLDQQVCPESCPRIGWVTTWNCRCGIASYSENLINALPSAEFLILAGHSQQRTKPDHPNVLRCWHAGGEDENLHMLRQVIINQKLTSIVIQFNFSFFKLQALAELLLELHSLDVHCYLFLHSTADVKPPHEPKSLATINYALQGVERLFVHSIHDLNFLKELGLVDNVGIFPHGVSVKPPLEKTPRQEKLIATYGFMLPHKGIRELIKAFEILRSNDPELRLLLLNALYPAGISENERCLCMQEIEQSPYNSDITMVNDYLAEEKIHQKLSQAEVIVFPCQDTQESSSASVRNGLATGRPVATTPLAIFEDVADVVYTLPGTTPEDIAEGIRNMLRDKVQLKEIKARQQTWLERHDWQILGSQLNNMLKADMDNGLMSQI